MRSKFGDKATAQFWNLGINPGLPEAVVKKARRQLATVLVTGSLIDLESPPGNRLKKLKGFDPPRYSIRINDQYRVTFAWDAGEAWSVKVEDYH